MVVSCEVAGCLAPTFVGWVQRLSVGSRVSNKLLVGENALTRVELDAVLLGGASHAQLECLSQERMIVPLGLG